MAYYKTAVLLSWLTVGGSFCIVSVVRGNYQYLPFQLIFMMVGGIVPALICAWALRALGKLSKLNWLSLWMLRGGYLGLAYVLMSNFMMKSVIGHVSVYSIKGFLCFLIFGPAMLMEIGQIGLLVIIFTGVVNGAVLNVLHRRHC